MKKNFLEPDSKKIIEKLKQKSAESIEGEKAIEINKRIHSFLSKAKRDIDQQQRKARIEASKVILNC